MQCGSRTRHWIRLPARRLWPQLCKLLRPLPQTNSKRLQHLPLMRSRTVATLGGGTERGCVGGPGGGGRVEGGGFSCLCRHIAFSVHFRIPVNMCTNTVRMKLCLYTSIVACFMKIHECLLFVVCCDMQKHEENACIAHPASTYPTILNTMLFRLCVVCTCVRTCAGRLANAKCPGRRAGAINAQI